MFFCLCPLFSCSKLKGCHADNAIEKEIIKKPKQIFDNGLSYEGEWRGKLREGFGIQTWPDGKTYERQAITTYLNTKVIDS